MVHAVFVVLTCLRAVYYKTVRSYMGGLRGASDYIGHSVDLLFLQKVKERLDPDSLRDCFEPWYEFTFDQPSLDDISATNGGTVEDKFHAFLIVFALAFTYKYDDHSILLKTITSNRSLEHVGRLVTNILFGSVEGIVSACSCFSYHRIVYSHMDRFILGIATEGS